MLLLFGVQHQVSVNCQYWHRILAQDVNDSDLSSVAWQQGGDLDFHWFHFQEFNYAVRLILADSLIAVSTDEINAPSASFTVYPNPAVNETRVSFSLTESKFIAYEVRDLQGRLMDTDNIGRFGILTTSVALVPVRTVSLLTYLNTQLVTT